MAAYLYLGSRVGELRVEQAKGIADGALPAAAAACEPVAGGRSDVFSARYSPRQYLVRQGACMAGVIEIVEGTAISFALLPDGRRQILEIHGPGAFVGVPLGAPQTAAVQAIGRVRARVHEREEVLGSPALQMRMFTQICEQLAAMQELVLGIGRKTASERIAGFLARLVASRSQTPKCAAGAPVEVKLPISQCELADHLALTSETVSREMKRLRQDKVIGPGHDRIAVLDPAELAWRAVNPRQRRCGATEAPDARSRAA